MALRYTFVKPTEGIEETYEYIAGAWELVETTELPVPEHSHPSLGDTNFTGDVFASGDKGLTGERTVGGYKITFKKGLLVGFEAV